MTILRVSIILVAVLALSACAANPVDKYTTVISSKNTNTLPAPNEPMTQYVGWDEIEDKLADIMSSNYQMVATTGYYGPRIAEDLVIQKAKQLNSAVAVYSFRYINSETQTLYFPIMSMYGYGKYSGYTTTMMPINSNSDIYENVVYYLSEAASKPKLGIGTTELSEDQKRLYERNTGCQVISVVKKSPAYVSNILRGDIIVNINGEDAIDCNNLSKSIENLNLGDHFPVTALRSGNSALISFDIVLFSY